MLVEGVPVMDYLDFDLKIHRGQDGQYPVEVINSPAGEGEAIMSLLLEDQGLQARLRALQGSLLRSGSEASGTDQNRNLISSAQALSASASAPAEQVVRDFGEALFGAL